MKKPVALVDLDGTLADFAGAMLRDLTAMLGPEETPLFSVEDEDTYPHVKARRRAIKSQPDWWFNLQRIPAGFLLLDMLRELGFKIHILTRGPKHSSGAWEQKVRWVRSHVPDASLTITLDKSLVYGRVLVDDWPDYVTPWLKHRPRGLVVMPDQPWNQGYEHPQVVRHLPGQNEELIRERLKGQLPPQSKYPRQAPDPPSKCAGCWSGEGPHTCQVTYRCPHGVAFKFRGECLECMNPTQPCSTCGGSGSVWDGRDFVTVKSHVPCPDCQEAR